jgi:hypothetical protein
VAALIKAKTGLEAELIEGARGEFTVWVGEEVVARKGHHGFPSDADVVKAVTRAVDR